MKHKPFFWFVFPSALAMLLFIFFPIVSVIVQSVHVEHEQVIKIVETCDLFGCKESTTVDHDANAALRSERPLGQFSGLKIYADRNHLAIDDLGRREQQRGKQLLVKWLSVFLPMIKDLQLKTVVN